MATTMATRELGESWAMGELQAIRDYAREWRWGDVARCIEGAYRSLGAEPPDVAHGPLFHRGEHPIQIAAREHDRAVAECYGL